MDIDDMKKRFLGQVKVRAFEDQFIDRKEEKEILSEAISEGVKFESARAALVHVCEANGYVLESNVYQRVGEMASTFAGNDGKIDEKEFNDLVAHAGTLTKGKRTPTQCKRIVVELLEKGDTKIKTGFFSNWYSRIKEEIGWKE